MMKNMELNQLDNRVRKLSFQQAKDTMLNFDLATCSALVDIESKEILFANRFDMVLNLPSKPQLTDLYNLLPNGFYQLLFKKYARAAQEVIFHDVKLSGNYHYHYTFQTKVIRYKESKTPYKFILHYESEPIILDINGEERFASIDKLQIIDFQKWDYFPTPMVKNNGTFCYKETHDLIRMAGRYIFEKLPSIFTPRLIDVLEELANGNDTETIAKNLDNIARSTVEGYRRDIRKIVKNEISVELNDIKFAMRLRELMIL